MCRQTQTRGDGLPRKEDYWRVEVERHKRQTATEQQVGTTLRICVRAQDNRGSKRGDRDRENTAVDQRGERQETHRRVSDQ